MAATAERPEHGSCDPLAPPCGDIRSVLRRLTTEVDEDRHRDDGARDDGARRVHDGDPEKRDTEEEDNSRTARTAVEEREREHDKRQEDEREVVRDRMPSNRVHVARSHGPDRCGEHACPQAPQRARRDEDAEHGQAGRSRQSRASAARTRSPSRILTAPYSAPTPGESAKSRPSSPAYRSSMRSARSTSTSSA